MQVWKYIKMVLFCLATSFGALLAASLLDIFIAAMYPRGYSVALFVVTFGVAGIFATMISYTSGIDYAPKKDQKASAILISCTVLTGLIMFFFIARVEGGEYEGPFKAFGIMQTLTNLIFLTKPKK
jgi:general stress protein CsbA